MKIGFSLSKADFFRGLVLALAYAVLGRISLLLAVPPGYSSPIFPPAGIALAAILLWGYRCGWGVWVGCFALNVALSLGPDFTSPWRSALLAAEISTAALIESVLGAYLVRRAISTPTSLLRSREVVKFLLLGGPISTLVGALLGVGSLVSANLVPSPLFLFNFWNWWVGDTLGVLVFAPLVFCFFAEPRELWVRRGISVALPLGFTFLVYVVILFQASGWEQKSVGLEFERAANDLAARIQKNFEGYLNSLYAVEGVLIASNFDDGDFQAAAQRWLSLYNGIYDISWNPRISRAGRAGFERSMRTKGAEGYQVRDLGVGRKPFPAPVREEYFPSQIVAPQRPGENVLGFDTYVDPLRHEALALARDSGNPVTTGPVTLVQRRSNRVALLVFHPVYSGDHSTLEARRKNLRGVIKASLSLEDVVDSAIGNRTETRCKLEIYGDSSLKKLLYRQQRKVPPGGTDLTSYGHSPRAWVTSLDLGNRRFWLRILPSGSYWENQIELGSWSLLGSGVVMIGLLAAFLLATSGESFLLARELEARMKISDQLRRKTEELMNSNEDLEKFAYAASHDLQEPLRTVATHLQLVERRLAGTAGKDINDSIRFSIEGLSRMNALIKDLLDYSRIGRHGKHELVDIKVLIDFAISNLHASIQEGAARVEVGPMPSLQLVRTEGMLLFQNLIGNAVKYQDKSRPPQVNIAAELKGDFWLFSIRDNGIGIPERYLERIFQVFQRLHGKEAYPGTGMGLAICKRIVEHVGGRIWAESTGNNGSTFFFTLPTSQSNIK